MLQDQQRRRLRSVGVLLHYYQSFRITASYGDWPTCQLINHQIPGDFLEPTTKRATARAIKLPNFSPNGGKYLLRQILRVGVLQAFTSSNPIDNGLVQMHELFPSLRGRSVGELAYQRMSRFWSEQNKILHELPTRTAPLLQSR